MIRMYKADIKGLGQNEFVPAGVWLTKKELDIVLERQYDDKKRNRVVHLGGRYFKPEDFRGVIDEKELSDLAKSGSPLFDSRLIESLAEQGYLAEIDKNCPDGYRIFVNKLVRSGQYQLKEGNEKTEINFEGKNRLEKLKQKFRLGRGDES